ncbi:MAG: D-ribose pyranase [Anaerolineae bacterium]
MKKTGLLNKDLSEVIAGMGHRDMLVIADAGLPIPPGVRRIDLAVSPNLPRFLDVVAAVLGELQVEEAIVAGEMAERSPETRAALLARLGDVPVREVLHEQFKQLTARAHAVVRTGEFTPYANVILIAGVVF